MAQHNFSSTPETTNLARETRIILGPCTQVLRDVLSKEISPSNLPQLVRTYLAKEKRCAITTKQKNLIYKADYSEFDITLLYTLLRNISQIQPHANTWGNDPDQGDRSVSANIERIRLRRNELCHNSDFKISNTDFNNKWQEIFDTVKELENYAGFSTGNQDAVLNIKTCSMDPEQESNYIKELLVLIKETQNIYGN